MTEQTKVTPPKFDLAIIKRDVVDITAERIRGLTLKNEINLPSDYSAENALKAAWLTLQEATDKDGNPVLRVCTANSISMALFNMIVMGLNPAKKQCYFIAYGKTLACQPSYFGDMAMAIRLSPVVSSFAYEVVYAGDVLTYKIDKGKKIITNHEQTLETVQGGEIVAAYCMALDDNGAVIRTEIMTMDDIKRSWKQSKMNPINAEGVIKEGSTHAKFTREMALKTVIRKVCKPIVNSSSDGYLQLAVHSSSGAEASERLELEMGKANTGEIIDIIPDPAEEQGEAIDVDPVVSVASAGPQF